MLISSNVLEEYLYLYKAKFNNWWDYDFIPPYKPDSSEHYYMDEYPHKNLEAVFDDTCCHDFASALDSKAIIEWQLHKMRVHIGMKSMPLKKEDGGLFSWEEID